MNLNNRCEVTDQIFSGKICQRRTFDGKKIIPYWSMHGKNRATFEG